MSRHATHVEGPFRYALPIETRFRDTDAMGHINNAVYLTYFEAARAGYYKAVTGRDFEGISDDPVSIILAHASVDFRSQAWYGERLLVACRTTWAGHSSFAFGYRVTADADSKRGRRSAGRRRRDHPGHVRLRHPASDPHPCHSASADGRLRRRADPAPTDVARVRSDRAVAPAPRTIRRTEGSRPTARTRPRLVWGAPNLLRACPSCGASIAIDARFCPDCGAAAMPAPTGGTRRQVTILFCDIVDSTALAQRLDAEALQLVIGRYFDLRRSCDRATWRHSREVHRRRRDGCLRAA